MKELLQLPTTSLLDVRSPMEFAMEHIEGAKNIPLNELSLKLDEVKQLSHPIVEILFVPKQIRLKIHIF